MFKGPQYRYGLMAWKVLKSLGVFGTGAAAGAMFPAEDAGLEEWAMFLALCLPPIITGVRNWIKHHPLGKMTIREIMDAIYRFGACLLLVTALGFLSSGCTTLGQSSVTTKFEETIAPDGTATTLFEAKSRGEVDTSLHKMVYIWGGEENQIIVGQDATGVTSPAQQALLSGFAQLIANMPGMWNSLLGAVQRSPEPVPVLEAP
jgi:hypothetical protein